MLLCSLINSKVILEKASTEVGTTLVKGDFSFHKYMMMYLQRKTKALCKL